MPKSFCIYQFLSVLIQGRDLKPLVHMTTMESKNVWNVSPCMFVFMYVCMYECKYMYVCVCIYMHASLWVYFIVLNITYDYMSMWSQ